MGDYIPETRTTYTEKLRAEAEKAAKAKEAPKAAKAKK